MEKKYRHEYKYICNSLQNAILKMRAKGLLRPDSHAGIEGFYDIRSLYFDTPEDTALREKLEGVSDKWSVKTVWGVGYKFEVV